MSEGLQTDERARLNESGPSAGRVDYPSSAIEPESAASYVADITTQLAELARDSRLEILAYLLDIAQLEAKNSLRRLRREACAS